MEEYTKATARMYWKSSMDAHHVFFHLSPNPGVVIPHLNELILHMKRGMECDGLRSSIRDEQPVMVCETR